MFEDFQRKTGEDGRRFGASLAVAGIVFGTFAVSMVAATAGVRSGAAEEELVQVEFAPPPEPEPPPPPPPPPDLAPRRERPDPRPAVVREELVQPEEIADDELEESDDALADDASGTGARDGSLDGRRGGTGVAPAPPPPPPAPPPPPRGPVMRPENAIGGEMVGAMPPIAYPDAARSSGVSGMVIVKCAIDLRGVPRQCSVLRGHPLLNDAALMNVQARRFTPVRLPDGTEIEVWKMFPVRFQLTNM